MTTDKKPIDCECAGWARTDSFIWTHHPVCALHDPTADVLSYLRELVRGIEAWAADEDGVHDACWDVYRRAKLVLGEPVKEATR